MKRKGKLPFDPKRFLAKVGKGKTISKYRKDQVVFSQGEVADAVFYIQKGKVKLTVVSQQAPSEAVRPEKENVMVKNFEEMQKVVWCSLEGYAGDRDRGRRLFEEVLRRGHPGF
jgi:CRP-like cAMP-binding protein